MEDLLRTYPGIADVAVIGIDHERFGEAPRAYVVKTPESLITEAEIEKYVAENTASYKHLVGGEEFIPLFAKKELTFKEVQYMEDKDLRAVRMLRLMTSFASRRLSSQRQLIH